MLIDKAPFGNAKKNTQLQFLLEKLHFDFSIKSGFGSGEEKKVLCPPGW